MNPTGPLHRQVEAHPFPRPRPAWQRRLWLLVQAGVFFGALIAMFAGLGRFLPSVDVPHMTPLFDLETHQAAGASPVIIVAIDCALGAFTTDEAP